MPRREFCTIGETRQRTERVCGCNAYKIQTWHRAFEVSREDRSVIDCEHLLAQGLIEESKAGYRNPKTCSADNVIHHQFDIFAVIRHEAEMDFGVLHGDTLDLGAQVQRELPNDLIANEPSRLGSEVITDRPKT